MKLTKVKFVMIILNVFNLMNKKDEINIIFFTIIIGI